MSKEVKRVVVFLPRSTQFLSATVRTYAACGECLETYQKRGWYSGSDATQELRGTYPNAEIEYRN